MLLLILIFSISLSEFSSGASVLFSDKTAVTSEIVQGCKTSTSGGDADTPKDSSADSHSISEDASQVQLNSVAVEAVVLAVDSSLDSSGFDVNSSLEIFPSVYHKDCFLLYRALCKLSMKSLHDEAGNLTDPIALQNKILSLELVLHILLHCGPAFCAGEKFVHVTKSYLCVSLLGNCTSEVALVTSLSLQIFVLLMDNFRDHLKSELEVFVTNIFLRILESENSSYEHKMRVMAVFHNIINDPSALVEIFVNYDCDFEAIDLFRRIVDAFAKLAKHPNNVQPTRSSVDFISPSKKGSIEEYNIRNKCVDGLVIILRSLLKTAGIDVTLELGNPSSVPNGAHNLEIKGKGVSRKSISNIDSLGDCDVIVDASVSEDDTVSGVDAVEAFDRKQRLQEEIETGILKFNLSAKKGLSYLINLGHVENTPISVANFFHQYQDRLDKTVIGEYLGKEREYENGFCLKVLHEYVDNMDLANMKFDRAVRYFLAGFRLPGEAQKIDRIMEKFAERYFLQNRTSFPSADMAFILAFSTIMLQTNLHNPAIREDKRMTKEQFVKQNKGISTDGELSDDLLKEIYDSIAAEPISLSQDDKQSRRKKEETAFAVFPISVDKLRASAFNDERKEMVRISEAMFKQKLRSRRGSIFLRSSQTDEAYARPMFELAWPPMLSVFSQLLETTDDSVLVSLCLEGIQHAIRISSRMEVITARNTFINTLVKFTTLDTVRQMQPKNVLVIKLIMEIALNDGEHLGESWCQVLKCVSQLARLQLFANRLHTDDVFFSDRSSIKDYEKKNIKGRSPSNSQSGSASVTDPFTKFFTGISKAESARQQEESNAEMIMLDIDPLIMDKIFISSQNLSSDSVIHFIKSLCTVSLLEISTSSSMNSLRGRDLSGDTATPRVFSLQKLVEVADFNMHIRPRIAWSNMWSILAAHFMHVGVHDNYAVAMFAIDSLKQLSIKFLQKEELSSFNFQRVFLQPFEVIMTRSKSVEIKELILRCLDIMIRACAQNIRSGWRSIFSIFGIAAEESDSVEIASIAFEITERLLNEQFHLLVHDFSELLHYLTAVASGSYSTLSLSALDFISICADHLAEGAVDNAIPIDISHLSLENSKQLAGSCENDAALLNLWWPLLHGLSTTVSDSRREVRNKALEMLLHVLRLYGDIFSPQKWNIIFKRILLPIVDFASLDSTKQPSSSWPTENPEPSLDHFSWIATTGSLVLQTCSAIFLEFNKKGLTSQLLPDLLLTIEGCICQSKESLAKIGLRAQYDLIMAISESCENDYRYFDPQTADLVCDHLCTCLLRNVCLNFSDVGILQLDLETPIETQNLLSECTVSVSRQKEALADHENVIGSQVCTPYGTGLVVQVMNLVFVYSEAVYLILNIL